MTKSNLFILITIPLFRIFFLYIDNVQYLKPTDIVRPSVLTIVMVFILEQVLYKLLHSRAKSIILTIFASTIFYFYDIIQLIYPSFQIKVYNQFYATQHTFLIPLLVFVFIMITMLFKNIQPHILKNTLQYIKNLGLILLAISILKLTTLQQVPTSKLEEQKNLAVSIPANRPDIYFIVLDAYAGSNVLQKYYNLDNSQFINTLTELGFYVAVDSKSNYTQTYLSISSILNLDYVQNFINTNPKSPDKTPLSNSVRNNLVINTLKKLDYQIIVLNSGWQGTNSVEFATNRDIGLSEYELALFKFTPLAYIFSEDIGFKIHRHRILNIFNTLSKTPLNQSPTFVYAHILSPHAPFVFDQNGNEIIQNVPFSYSDHDWTRYYHRTSADYVKGYSAQIKFVNDKIINVVTNIINNSTTPPIIIIQGDHGPASIYRENPNDLNQITERTNILNAYYFGATTSNDLKPTLTPVNSFRIIFNTFFNTKLPILPNHVYQSPFNYPYKLTEVTHLLYKNQLH